MKVGDCLYWPNSGLHGLHKGSKFCGRTAKVLRASWGSTVKVRLDTGETVYFHINSSVGRAAIVMGAMKTDGYQGRLW